MPSDVAVCRFCGSFHVRLIHYTQRTPDAPPEEHFFYGCDRCGACTHDRPTAKEAADDVVWLPIHEVRFP